ncbi:beta-mannosidase [Clostridium sp. USBA 49]|uniref:glycoside hydrolase family 2 protein n=1 Tax=Clostridium sp. USBA 49 TaxID=1881060 RepID=UPI000999EAE2|nr:glycoside hydrolase family 2 TIM barrel-domain containing protein [Clostridium sp. USBA 49]SKA85437.1 beta-mannosidase [Clostridium sp. USBA 49]
MEVLLNNLNWQLAAFWPYTPLLGNSVETGVKLQGITPWIKSEVPGSVYKDLLNSGLIEDPYYELNSLKCEWVANRWWIYKTTFDIENYNGSNIYKLVFKGVDYKAHFYLNGTKLAEHEGMYDHVVLDITSIVKKEVNELLIMIEQAPEEMSQIGYTSKTYTQKSRFNYKWDFSTRLVNLGLWDDVGLKIINKNEIGDTYLKTTSEENHGIIDLSLKLNVYKENNCKIKLKLSFQDTCIEEVETNYSLDEGERLIRQIFTIENPKLWNPNGYGEQPLYKVEIFIYDENTLLDAKTLYTGIRSLSYSQNENSREDSLSYTVIINGIKIYIKGVNFVPMDHMYGCVKREDYDKALKAMKEANINLVRVWGGGIIEKEAFYELCDKYGIMVWQEFIQSSSGLDNVPSKRPKFLKLLRETAIQAVKVKRNHVSLTFWSGGNELTDANGVPSTYEDQNIAMLRGIVDALDGQRLFLPTSSSGPLEFLNPDKPGYNHDVHGPWKFGDVIKHYDLFNHSDSLIHSEFGTDGLVSIETMRKFLSGENIKITTMEKNLSWRHHGECWDTYVRDKKAFAEIESIEDFINISQYLQAEGLRYAIEANRRRKFQNSGSIIWQFNEPWPNVSCTSLVDYYGNKKLAYDYVKLAFKPIHISLKYDGLKYKSGSEFKGEVYLHNDLKAFSGNVSYKILDKNLNVLLNKNIDVEIQDNSCKFLEKFKFNIPKGIDLFYIELELTIQEKSYKNLYIFSAADGYVYKNINDFWEKIKNFKKTI